MLRFALLLAAGALAFCQQPGQVEILRDKWGVPHVFGASDADGFFGAGYAAAEDRLLQMELFRRRATGRLAEVFGAAWVEPDRGARIVGMGQHCRDAAAALPDDIAAYLRAYAAGVNAWVESHPETVARRFRTLGVTPAPWTPSDCICAWMAVAGLFEKQYDEGAVQNYLDFRRLAAEVGEEAALAERGMILDDGAAVVPESEMARDDAAYAKLKARAPMPGYWFRSFPDEVLRFSHAWAVAGARTVTGAPLLESDPQTPVNNPPLWWEFHLTTPRFNVRGIGVAGSPGMLIGFNRQIAWGATALGAGSTVTYVEKLTEDGQGYLYRGEPQPFERRTETIEVKGGAPVMQEVLRTRHGFVFDRLTGIPADGEAYVSHNRAIETKGTSVLAMLNMMGSGNWDEFRDAMGLWYSPGLHVVYADWAGNLGYQTLVHVPLTRRSPRIAMEGWTGLDEVEARIPLDEMPHMFNPERGFISHANNLPVGSWYPYDLGISTGGTGHTARSLRLLDVLGEGRIYSVDTFESGVHRDDVDANVASLLPVARRVAAQAAPSDRSINTLLAAVADWDLHFHASQASYTAAKALAGNLLLPYRRSPLNSRLGGGEGGVSHLARLVREQYGDGGLPSDPDVRNYMLEWLRAAAAQYQPSTRGPSPEVLRMPYQQNGPFQFPALDAALELVSPPLSCAQISTIWSQGGNSYTQIVDLSDPDNSRTLLPPGISEDAESPFHANQMELWAAGGTHPAPLSRGAVEEVAVSRTVVDVTETRSGSGADRAVPARRTSR